MTRKRRSRPCRALQQQRRPGRSRPMASGAAKPLLLAMMRPSPSRTLRIGRPFFSTRASASLAGLNTRHHQQLLLHRGPPRWRVAAAAIGDAQLQQEDEVQAEGTNQGRKLRVSQGGRDPFPGRAPLTSHLPPPFSWSSPHIPRISLFTFHQLPFFFNQVVFVATEVHPWSKTGGLADVTAALPAALAAK